jgi:hypothetical protein
MELEGSGSDHQLPIQPNLTDSPPEYNSSGTMAIYPETSPLRYPTIRTGSLGKVLGFIIIEMALCLVIGQYFWSQRSLLVNSVFNC